MRGREVRAKGGCRRKRHASRTKKSFKDSRSVIANGVNTTAAKHGEQQGCGAGRWAIEQEHRSHEGGGQNQRTRAGAAAMLVRVGLEVSNKREARDGCSLKGWLPLPDKG